ncbi:hypothetical protein C8J57DRAFT_338029 [Mycena rebaudengoi]|nr:hypothetical protein C8J57DRAFT_338029 [Mycena rebaudengoi]
MPELPDYFDPSAPVPLLLDMPDMSQYERIESPMWTLSPLAVPKPGHTCTTLCFQIHNQGYIIGRGDEPFCSSLPLYGMDDPRLNPPDDELPEDNINWDAVDAFFARKRRENGVVVDAPSPPPPEVFKPQRPTKALPIRARAAAADDVEQPGPAPSSPEDQVADDEEQSASSPAPSSSQRPRKPLVTHAIFARAVDDVRKEAVTRPAAPSVGDSAGSRHSQRPATPDFACSSPAPSTNHAPWEADFGGSKALPEQFSQSDLACSSPAPSTNHAPWEADGRGDW